MKYMQTYIVETKNVVTRLLKEEPDMETHTMFLHWKI